MKSSVWTQIRVFRLTLGCLSLLLFMTACGYHWTSADELRTMTVPFVVGDEDGLLTAELVRSLSTASQVRIVPDGRYRLEVSIVHDQVDPLGFRRDPQEVRGKVRKDLVQNEARKTIDANVTLIDSENLRPVIGPLKVSAYVDFDYVDGDCLQDLQFKNARGEKIIVLPFSLGQLESQESALEAAQRPLYRSLSQKIVDVISAQW